MPEAQAAARPKDRCQFTRILPLGVGMPAAARRSSRATQRRTVSSWVFFIRDPLTLDIKIGAAHDPEEQRLALQNGNPRALILEGVVPGGKADEAALRGRFARLALPTGDWFRTDPELEALIAASMPFHAGDAAEA